MNREKKNNLYHISFQSNWWDFKIHMYQKYTCGFTLQVLIKYAYMYILYFEII